MDPFSAVESSRKTTLLANAKCLDTQGAIFEGDLMSGRGIELEISPCVNDTFADKIVCMPQDDIDAAARLVYINTYGTRAHFDVTNLNAPIKTNMF